jgi:hypothetical protein
MTYTYYSDLSGLEQVKSSEPINVQIEADTYLLAQGDCTNVYWQVSGAGYIWFNGNRVDATGNLQVCPDTSTTYSVDAANTDNDRAGSLIFIEVVANEAPPAVGAEQAVEIDRCSLFESVNFEVKYLDWTPGAPLTFYFKIPGGVPGLEKKVAGDTGKWDYIATIGSYESGECSVYEDVRERLYCTVSLPEGYVNAIRPLSLQVNDCTSTIYSEQSAFLPDYVQSGGSGSSGGGGGSSSSGGGGSSGSSCGSAPSNTNLSAFHAWCDCIGGSYYVTPTNCEPPGCTAYCTGSEIITVP